MGTDSYIKQRLWALFTNKKSETAPCPLTSSDSRKIHVFTVFHFLARSWFFIQASFIKQTCCQCLIFTKIHPTFHFHVPIFLMLWENFNRFFHRNPSGLQTFLFLLLSKWAFRMTISFADKIMALCPISSSCLISIIEIIDKRQFQGIIREVLLWTTVLICQVINTSPHYILAAGFIKHPSLIFTSAFSTADPTGKPYQFWYLPVS